MASYTVTISIDPTWVDDFNNSGMSLCMAKATKDGSGKDVYNVIAKTISTTFHPSLHAFKTCLQPTLTVTWTDEYMIKATTTVFNKGAKIQGEADTKAISMGETYSILGWTKISTYEDTDNVDNQSFGFQNAMPCSILLSMKQDDVFVPVYISPSRVPPGMTTLTPIPKVIFWFQQRVASSTMIVNFYGKTISVNPVAGGNTRIQYDPEGKWKTVHSE